jgi:glycosyltransferase involved in cell wall biosynthesis
VHDLIQLEGDGMRGAARAAIVAPWMRRMIAESRAVITGSDHARGCILDRFPAARGKVSVIPHGVSPHLFSSAAAPRSALETLGVTGPYLLAVANKKPHKNLEMAIRVLARSSATDPTLRLVLVGDRFPHVDRLRALARELGVLDRIVDLASISDRWLALLYAHAEALLFPSRVEGFGLPVLEAMAAGAPVVAVDVPPIPSVVGEAGDIVPIDDDAAMCAAVAGPRPASEWRADRVAAGRARAREFTWERSAASLADLLCGDVSA